MRKAVLFDDFASQCKYFVWDTDTNNGYGCRHPEQENKEEGEETGCCLCFCCPLGIEAEQEDLTEPVREIDWDGLCECGEVTEGEYLLVDAGEDASEDQKEALYSYERYMHRYDKVWLDAHGIANRLAG